MRNRKLKIRNHLLPVLLLLTSYFLLSTSYFRPALGQESPDVEAGKKIYEKRCIYCHGPEGRGDGPAAPFLNPPPTNFARGRFKFRTTPEKTLPRDEDLFRTISEGLPGTGMPNWNDVLTEQERWQVVRYIKTFNTRFQDYNPEPLPTLKPVPMSRESIEKGKELFFRLECNRCHGDEGRADGRNAAELRSWPRNLTQGWTFRGGRSPQDVYFRITYGAEAMPSFIGDSTEEERWHVVNYVLSLSSDTPPPVRVVLKARRMDGELPTDPNDPRWEELESYYYPLIGQVIQDPRLFNPTVRGLNAKAAYNTQELVIRLSWDDPTKSQIDPEKGTFMDSAAVQFPVTLNSEQERPFFLRGNEQAPVYLWQWSNDQAMKESNFWGLKMEQVQPSESLNLQGQGVWHHGQYRVVLKRSLATNDKERDLQFVEGQLIPIAFSVWDGGNGEVGEKMALSHWYYLLLEPPASPVRYVYPTILAVGVIGLEWWAVRRARGHKMRS